MAKKIGEALKQFFSQRTNILLLLFLGMSAILVARVFQLQIIRGADYAQNFDLTTTRTRTIKSSRGNIYDAKGRLLAWNELSNSVIIEDNGNYASLREKNLALNGEILRLTRLIKERGDVLTHDFRVVLDETGSYTFDVGEGFTLDRFRADVFGRALIEDMKEEERTATAQDVVNFLCGDAKFALTPEEEPYTAEELASNGLPTELSPEEILDILVFRYQLSLVSYQRYLPVTVATAVSDATVAVVEELSEELQGVSIAEDYTRRYVDSDAMGPILGYTGAPSAEDLEELRAIDPQYTGSSIVGKSGLEQAFETTLQGTDGSETVTVNNVGKVLSIDDASRVAPAQGDDIYLSIDLELQEAVYHIVEQRVAGVLITNIDDVKEITIDENNDTVSVPIYSIYNALIANNLIDLSHLSADDALSAEQSVQRKIHSRTQEIVHWLAGEFSSGAPKAYVDLTREQRVYMSYVATEFLMQNEKIVNSSLVDASDPVYRAYHMDGSISLREFLLRAINQNWVNLSRLGEANGYLDSEEILTAISGYVQEHLPEDETFTKRVCRYLILDDVITPDELCQILYDQGFFSRSDGQYAAFTKGDLSARDLLVEKIEALELSPSELALDPCAGSAVITDPATGQVQACVSYPGYNSNYLANTMDEEYFSRLAADNSSPFYNKATQQLTAPGSTFKPVMAAAGLTEAVIDEDSLIRCDGRFGVGFMTEGDQLYCAERGGHGELDVVDGLIYSCNVYFCTVGYRLGQKETGDYRERVALRYIQEYATGFGLDHTTGVEISESSPTISAALAIPSSIGQGEHAFATVQLAKYVATIATRGIGYSLTLVDHQTDADGRVTSTAEREIDNEILLDEEVWDDIYDGMRGAILANRFFNGVGVDLYGKTGTAQDDLTRPSHAVFIGYTKETGADIALAVRIPFGYSSINACLLARDMVQYYDNVRDEASIITGRADNSEMSTEVRVD